MNYRIVTIALTCILMMCSGCGGGGGAFSVADGGIGGTGISFGSISAFGSVVVNGTRFNIGNQTEISVEGQAATQEELKIGFVVRVESTLNTGVANRIEFAEEVRGRLDSVVINNIDALDATIGVLGQTVKTGVLTNFVNVDISTLSVNDVIAVSGTRDAQGIIIASYLERLNSTTEFRVTGPVSKLSNTTFNISALSIDFSSATINDGLPVVDQIVRVKGEIEDFTASPPSLIASSIEPGITLAADPEDEVELEGVVTNFTSVSDFEIGGQRVNASSAVFESGSASEIRLNTSLEAEGNIDADGVLQAEKVDIEQSSVISIEANVEAVSTANDSLTLLGVEIGVNELTTFEDGSDAELSSFGLSDINVGDRIQIRGFLDGAAVIASRLEREDTNPDPDERVILQSPVEAKDETNTTLTLLGITVTAATASGTEFEDQNDNTISQGAFYGAVEVGSIVKVRWDTFVSPINPPDEVSLELEE